MLCNIYIYDIIFDSSEYLFTTTHQLCKDNKYLIHDTQFVNYIT